MSPTGPTQLPLNLARHDGWCLLTAAEAILKSTLEAESPVGLICGPSVGGFARVFEAAGTDSVQQLLHAHGTSVIQTPDAGRGLTLADQAARSGRRALAFVPNVELASVVLAIAGRGGPPLSTSSALCIILEDDPTKCPGLCPRQVARRLELPVLEPTDVGQLRAAVQHGLRVSRAESGPAIMVVHRSVLQSCETLEMHPNRVMDPVDAILARPRRPGHPRWAEAGGALRMARRLQLNRGRNMPSPGERAPVGFITIGPTDVALSHLVYVLRLHGRIPVLQLGLVNPLDASAVRRILDRCEQVVVLEPRPGSVEPSVLGIAETMRVSGERPAAVLGQALGGDADGHVFGLGPDEAVHPSRLARKIVHLLHTVRPGLKLASTLVPDPPELPASPPARGSESGAAEALAAIRRMLVDVDQWLHDRTPMDGGPVEPTALAIDGVEPGPPRRTGGPILRVETWDAEHFRRQGLSALQQIAGDDQPSLIVICSVGCPDVRDVARLVAGAIPSEHADRVGIESADFNNRVEFREVLRKAVMNTRSTVIVANDGPPAHFDVAAIEHSFTETDHLGYERLQRAIRSADDACSIRVKTDSHDIEGTTDDPAPRLDSGFTVSQRARRVGRAWQLRIRPLSEQVEVVRSQPPVHRRVESPGSNLPLPTPVHGQQSQWRVHLAGFRGPAPGLAALALAEAARVMGYHVRGIDDATPIGRGRRAWSQLLFSRARRDGTLPPIATTIPYAEADLLVGLDAQESLRALTGDGRLRAASAHRTFAVLNTGAFSDEPRPSAPAAAADDIRAALTIMTRPDHQVFEDVAGACRRVFHTDRVTDLALIGIAFQLGLVPTSLPAMETGLKHVQQLGFGRSLEAFHFGRELAVDRKLFTQPQPAKDERLDRVVRRTLCGVRGQRWGGRRRTAQLAHLLYSTLAQVPGLAETGTGRQARRDFVTAAARCLAWGGISYAQRYAELVTALYRADRGDTGRAITRNAIVPLAEAMLVRDPIYVATTLTSAELRRHTRQRLNVRLARDDRVQRRYLTRIELLALGRRFRFDLVTSDWLMVLLALGRHFIPKGWRGSNLERQRRSYVIDLIERAARGAARDYQLWARTLKRLHDQALDDRLRGMALSELCMFVEPGAQPVADSAALASHTSPRLEPR